MKLTQLFKEFFASEKAGGFLLIACTLVSLAIANSSLGESYIDFWEQYWGSHTIVHWINDGLMTIFFLLIGLELEREIYAGELSKLRDAVAPIVAAIGGMFLPAGIYLLLTRGTDYTEGAGVPMATDIAFALGILSLLGDRVPLAAKVFLTALAIIDDLGAILIIAFFYTDTIHWQYLLGALGIIAALGVLNRVMGVKNLLPYLAGGVVAWYLMLHSGVHATITGVLLAFVIPFGSGGAESPSYILQHKLHYPVAFVLLPLFALANTAIPLQTSLHYIFTQPYTLGIVLGLAVGKPLGIAGLTWLAKKLGWLALPEGLSHQSIVGLGCLAGIGFTMSIFISLLAFSDAYLINNAKVAIMVASVLAGVLGFGLLSVSFTQKQPAAQAT